MTPPSPDRGRATGGAAVPARSRLALIVLPTLLLGGASLASTFLAFGPGLHWLAPLLLLLLLVCCGRLALSTVGPLLGLWPGRPAGPQAAPRRAAMPAGRVRTAILLPVFNEPPEPVADALRVMSEALGPDDDVAFFVLSDTQDPERARHEAAFFPAHAVSRSGVEVRYRRRTPNAGRKAGNIAQFCADHGAAFEFAIILDADSLMTADAIRGLIAALREDPDAALVQSVSYPIGGATLFARMQQFGARLNTPLSVAGQDLWQHRGGTYWGHNAIVRLGPFIEHATLPVLPGRPPLGGEILCHDTIEAALLLRAGWDVRLAPGIAGSYETTPSNLVDYLARERRWCQGNLQHLRLLLAPGFRPASRLHIGMGILYYLATPPGLALSLLLLLLGGLGGHAQAAGSSRLVVEACLWVTLFLLFAPRLAHLGRALLLPGVARRGFGGRGRLMLGVLAEQVAGMLLAPIVSVSVTGFVIDTFRGRVVTWNTAVRGDRPVGWREAWQRFRVHTALGLGATGLVWAVRPALLLWSVPFLAGLIVSIPLACALGSVRLGRLARRLGLFVTIDELAPVAEQLSLAGAARPANPPAWPRWPHPRRGDMTAASGD